MARSYDISKDVVWQAYLQVKATKGAAGVDNQTRENFEGNLKGNLFKIWNRMASGSYFPPAVKAVAIPKKSGGTRMLDIPSISDRIAQTVVKMYLEPQKDPISTLYSNIYLNLLDQNFGTSAATRRNWELSCIGMPMTPCWFAASMPWRPSKPLRGA
jgi:RNA-directed DNA polymerase